MAYLKSTNINGDLTISGGGNINLSDSSNILDNASNPVMFQNKSKQRTGGGYLSSGNYSLNFSNSDSVGYNTIYFSDACTSFEGINFPYNTSAIDFDNYTFSESDWMNLRGYDGDLYFMNARVPTSATIGKTLWSGSWSSGSITVPDMTRYRMYYIYTEDRDSGSAMGTVIIACRTGTWLRGVGAYVTATPNFEHYYFNAQSTDDWKTLNFIECASQRNNAQNTNYLAVRSILGIV